MLFTNKMDVFGGSEKKNYPDISESCDICALCYCTFRMSYQSMPSSDTCSPYILKDLQVGT